MFLEKLTGVLASEKKFISDRLNLAGFALSAIINIIHWLLLYFKLQPGSRKILLHYNVINGPDWINQGWYIYLIPGLALLTLILNFAVASSFYKKEKLSSHFFALATIAIQIIFLTASLVLININANV